MCHERLQQHHLGKPSSHECILPSAQTNVIFQEADRLWFEDRIPGVPNTHVAIFGI